MHLTSLLIFAAALFVAAGSPGPSIAALVARVIAKGFREDAPEGDPWRLRLRREGPAGFPQAYLLDPDRNIVEINGAP